MKIVIVRKLAVLLAGVCAASLAQAVCDPPHREPTDCTPSPSVAKAAPTPAPSKARQPRRSVQQTIERMPQSPAPAPVYGYRPSTPPAAPPAPSGPIPVNCAGGVCRDPAGNTYQPNASGGTVNADGRPCAVHGNIVQCN